MGGKTSRFVSLFESPLFELDFSTSNCLEISG